MYIYLPRADAKVASAVAERPPAQAPDHPGAQVLLVDDDAAVRDITASMLRDIGYDVLEAGSGGAALERIGEKLDFDLIIIDVAMPGMSGAELARRIRAKRPALPILFVTGFADRAALEGVSESSIVGKPFLSNELADKVRLALAGQGAALAT